MKIPGKEIHERCFWAKIFLIRFKSQAELCLLPGELLLCYFSLPVSRILWGDESAHHIPSTEFSNEILASKLSIRKQNRVRKPSFAGQQRINKTVWEQTLSPSYHILTCQILFPLLPICRLFSIWYLLCGHWCPGKWWKINKIFYCIVNSFAFPESDETFCAWVYIVYFQE